ncbi:MAG: hypothetical protein RR090_07970 [Niameybacter sp.]|uniref:hypothetical protein n=1 Tax=Niameybacter sp. TaxID=2033640 RepID=UPI002FC749DD
MFKSKAQKQIELQINDLKMYLENNYKDLAIEARKEAVQMVDDYYKMGKIKEKSYLGYKKTLGEYTELMKDYNHQRFYRS